MSRQSWPDDVWPPVSVVVPTRERPELVTEAVRSILGQDYPGPIECLVVFDQCEPHEIDVDGLLSDTRTLKRLENSRTPGLAGNRNTGIDAATGEIVAHCDDDDFWHVDKLTRQLQRWREEPSAVAVASGLIVRSEDGDLPRPAPERAEFADFLDSRIMEIHSSNLLVRRADLLGEIGLIDEKLPHSFGEDYEWLLRATRVGPIVCVPDPLIVLRWNRPSFYMSKWQNMIDGLTYILDKFPEFADAPAGRARIDGQLAFAYAAMGNRREALRWALRTFACLPKAPKSVKAQIRALAAVLVAARVVKAEKLVRFVQARGRGL